MLPSQVNNSARQMMADVRAWYEEPSWVDYGYTVAYASGTSFTVTGADATAQFVAGRRVKLVGGTTVYGVVASSSFSTNTTVNVTLDSGTVPADLTEAYYSAIAPLAISVSWDSVTDIPAFGTRWPAWSEVTSKPTTFTPEAHNHTAAEITSGVLDTGRLGTGTASSSTYLRGDGSWSSLPPGTAATWGGITGTLADQTDLNSALSGKEGTIVGAATSITSANLTASRALTSDGSGKVAVSAVTATELGHLDGVTSNVQTQLNAKQATVTGAATTITGSNLAASRAVASDASGKVVASDVTSTELGYLDGVTSSIQTQLNGKAATSHNHAATQITSGVLDTARLGSGTPSVSTFLRGDGSWASLPGGSATWGAITGTLSDQTDLQTALNGKAASSHTHAATDVVSGTFATARLGSGTASSSTFLRGDGSWSAIPAQGVSWGSITGSLVDQTDLNIALNAKQATITGGATSIASANLTASRALVSDASGKVGASAVTSTELGYLDGVTSSVQTQLNGKEPTLASNRKRQIFVQATTPSGPSTGDLWVW
jgi:hypothetical protein